MSGQTAIAAVKQFKAHGAGPSKVSFIKELSIGMVLGLSAGMLWKVTFPPYPSPLPAAHHRSSPLQLSGNSTSARPARLRHRQVSPLSLIDF